jgi:hypothetical protein
MEKRCTERERGDKMHGKREIEADRQTERGKDVKKEIDTGQRAREKTHKKETR